MTRRQCTQDYKLDVIYRKVRELAGIKRKSPGPTTVVVEQLIGISLDEAHRMKDARFRWIQNVYPLVDLGITREACRQKLESWGWTNVPKSACTFCPYHNDEMWLDMKRHDPESWADAVAVDAALRTDQGVAGFRGEAFLHECRIPLTEVDLEARVLRPKRTKQGKLLFSGSAFGNECEGMCGV
jgi:hypothetical protein